MATSHDKDRMAARGRMAPPSRGLRRALGAILVGFGLAASAPSTAGVHEPPVLIADCGNPLLRVHYGHAIDLRHACEALRRVSAFLLADHGLRMATPIDITFVERAEIAFGTEHIRVLGLHDRTTRAILITTMTSDWLRQPDRLMFRLPVDEELHVSLIVHELVHALLKDNYRIAAPGFASDEYLAYAVQLATMEEGTRRRVLAAYEGADFASLDEINDIIHLANPHEFGVRAYRHFARDGHAYMVEMILSGRFLPTFFFP
jgi:hypothetical protein